jgi:lipopolysaccharide transport system ATP-binding protein
MSTVIKVENLSKRYRLGVINRDMLYKDLQSRWAKFRGKDDPNAPISAKHNKRLEHGDEFWALRNVDLEVKEGEILGIIGRNGAGKSTLLKILSQITAPTEGSIKVKGRIASLLEVGTGFHPELTGRENIYLNGAILGMTRKEVRSKFDEIVAFADIDEFINTPVKRYSSGMYVRLAFAVAAHLDPEILIIDEVLAVGDASFQKKCLGKMQEVSTQGGRTVLFVSHNMTAVQSLCTRAVLLSGGETESVGKPEYLISQYLAMCGTVSARKNYRPEAYGDSIACLLEASVRNHRGEVTAVLDFYEGGAVEFTYQVFRSGYLPLPNAHFFDQKGDYVMVSSENQNKVSSEPGVYKTHLLIPPHFLNTGRYSVGLCVATHNPVIVHHFDKEGLVFDIIEDMEQRGSDFRSSIPGIIRPRLEWQTERIS